MHKFINAQRLRGEASLADLQFLSILPSQEKSVSILSSITSDCNDVDVLQILRCSTLPLSSIHSFKSTGIATLRSPLYEDIFDTLAAESLKLLYVQLYPNEIIDKISPFYERSGRVTLCGQLMGSVLNASSCASSSVIMAYWPVNSSTLDNIDYSHKRIGIVQYYFRHKIVLQQADGSCKYEEHIFAYVIWKQRHPNEAWFGISATVCLDLNEPNTMCNYIPIQRIHDLCAHCLLKLNIAGFEETVFVAIPISLKYAL